MPAIADINANAKTDSEVKIPDDRIDRKKKMGSNEKKGKERKQGKEKEDIEQKAGSRILTWKQHT